VTIRGLHKTYVNGILHKRQHTAIESLDLDIPPTGIHVFCGRNGSGKTTLLRIIAGLESATEGEVNYLDGMSRPAAGDLGIVPQKNVLWDELTCAQHLTLWSALKRPSGAPAEEVGELLAECGLLGKKHAAAGSLSGGQKRRLQLAIGLVGGSQLVLIDEATSGECRESSRIYSQLTLELGVDPISRRAIWRALVTARTRRTIIYTTHFLDEADLLADRVFIMTAPGHIVARGSPVLLKTGHSQGYVISCAFDNSTQQSLDGRRHRQVLTAIRRFAPSAVMLNTQDDDGISLRTHNPRVVSQVLRLLDKDKRRLGLRSFDIRATTLSDVFIKLMGEEKLVADGLEKMYPGSVVGGHEMEDLAYPPSSYRASMSALSEQSDYSAHAPRRLRRKEGSEAREHTPSRMSQSLLAIPEAEYSASRHMSGINEGLDADWYDMDRPMSTIESHNPYASSINKPRDPIADLTEGRRTSALLQAGVLWRKRMLVARRGWAVPFLAAVLAIGGACIPLFFINNRQNRCVRNDHEDMRYSLFLPISPFSWNQTGRTYVAPPEALASLQYPMPGAYPLQDNSAFRTSIEATYGLIDTGGVSVQPDNTTTFAWEASPGNIAGNVMLNLASNTMFNIALNKSRRAVGYGPHINGEIQPMPSTTPRGIGPAIKWISFFGSSMVSVQFAVGCAPELKSHTRLRGLLWRHCM
jgi:ABC-type multidrug transport system ATPase subunit